MLALDVLRDRLVHGVAGDAHRLAVDDAGERDDRDVGRPAADVHDHVAGGFGNRQPGADRRGHRLFDQVHLAGLGAIGAVLHRAALHLRNLRRHADDDARADEALAAVGLLDEVAEHLLGGFEVGDHAVAHRADGGDAAGRPAEHLLRVVADGLDLVVDVIDRHDGRFVEHDAGAAGEHAGVRGTEVNRQVVREERQRAEKHS